MNELQVSTQEGMSQRLPAVLLSVTRTQNILTKHLCSNVCNQEVELKLRKLENDIRTTNVYQ